VRWEAGLGEGRNRLIDRGGLGSGVQPGRANTDFLDLDAFSCTQGLCDTADTRSAVHAIDSQRELGHRLFLCCFDDTAAERVQCSRAGWNGYGRALYGKGDGQPGRIMQREFPLTPLVGIGAVVVHEGRVLLVRRGNEPLKGRWSLPGGLLEVGEPLTQGVIREVREETGLEVEPIELVELLDRIHREGERVRYHYVIADYLCRVTGGALRAASDADAVRWVERTEWNSHSALRLDPVTVRVVEAGWQRAQGLAERRQEGR